MASSKALPTFDLAVPLYCSHLMPNNNTLMATLLISTININL